MSAAPLVVIAVGNSFRGDDGVAFRIVGEAASQFPRGTAVVETDGEPTRLLDAWDGAAAAIVVDAARAGGRAGTLHRIVAVSAGGTLAPDRRWRAWCPGTSTHGAGVRAAVDLGRALGRLPERLVVLGIEGHDFAGGDALSPPVASAVPEAVAMLVAEAHSLSSSLLSPHSASSRPEQTAGPSPAPDPV